MAVFTLGNEIKTAEKLPKPAQIIDKPVVIDELIEGNKWWVVEADGTRHVLGIPKWKLKEVNGVAFTCHWQEHEGDEPNEFIIDRRWEV